MLFKKKKINPRNTQELLDKILKKMRDTFSHSIIPPAIQFPPLIQSQIIMGDFLKQTVLNFECSVRSQLIKSYEFAKIIYFTKEFLKQIGERSELNEWIFEYCQKEYSKSYLNNLMRFYLFTDKYKKILGTALTLNEIISNIK